MHRFILIIALLSSGYSHSIHASELRISAEELNQNLSNDDIIILDVRDKNDYDVEHIDNAISFPAELTYDDKTVNGKIQQPQLMQKYLRERGIDTRSKVVIYDIDHVIDASRVFWALEVYGITHLRVLDKGFNYWKDKEYPVSQSVPSIQPGNYISTINHKRLASKFATQLSINHKNKLIIDARSRPAYLGEVSVAKRFGHIPSAISVPFTENLIQENGFTGLKSIDELRELYASVPKDKKIIIYCKIGRVSTANYFALRELGYDVTNYDASWREWGNDESLPIEK